MPMNVALDARVRSARPNSGRATGPPARRPLQPLCPRTCALRPVIRPRPYGEGIADPSLSSRIALAIASCSLHYMGYPTAMWTTPFGSRTTDHGTGSGHTKGRGDDAAGNG